MYVTKQMTDLLKVVNGLAQIILRSVWGEFYWYYTIDVGKNMSANKTTIYNN